MPRSRKLEPVIPHLTKTNNDGRVVQALEHDGKLYTFSEFSEICGRSADWIRWRYREGMTTAEMIAHQTQRNYTINYCGRNWTPSQWADWLKIPSDRASFILRDKARRIRDKEKIPLTEAYVRAIHHHFKLREKRKANAKTNS